MNPNWAKIADKGLEKVPTERIYEDLAQAGLKKSGSALADVIDIVTIPLLPLLHARKKIAIYLDNNLKRYEESLQKIQDEPTAVPELIGVPILQKLTYLSKGELADAFINLLTKASFDSSIHQVHPAFITTLSDLSRDEAVILRGIENGRSMPVIRLERHIMEKDDPQFSESLTIPYPRLTGLEKKFKIDFPQNINLYVRNLERLGIFEFEDGASLVGRDAEYQELEKQYHDEISELKKNAEIENALTEQNIQVEIKRRLIRITPFGSDFIDACLSKD